MDILKEEINKKRKLLESNSLIDDKKKFFKRIDLIRKNDEEYWKKVNEKEDKKRKEKEINNTFEKNDDIAALAKSPEELAKLKLKKLITNQTGSNNLDNDNKNERILSRKEVIKRLRERDQPILMFGESEIDAFRRLRKLEIVEPDTTDRGFRNDFQVNLLN